MSRPLPLYVTLGRLTAEAREKLADEKLALDVVRDAASKAARDGLNVVTIPLGAAPLGGTKAAKELESTLKGFSFEWLGSLGNDRKINNFLRLSWNIHKIE